MRFPKLGHQATLFFLLCLVVLLAASGFQATLRSTFLRGPALHIHLLASGLLVIGGPWILIRGLHAASPPWLRSVSVLALSALAGVLSSALFMMAPDLSQEESLPAVAAHRSAGIACVITTFLLVYVGRVFRRRE